MFVFVIIKTSTFIPQLASVILRVRSAQSVMSVGVSAAAGPTCQAGAVINVQRGLMDLALPGANVRDIF